MQKGFRGLIDDKGNLKFHNMTDFKSFLGQHKSKDVIISLILEDSPASKFSINYFLFVVCVEFVKIFKEHYGEVTTKEVIASRLMSWCPVTKDCEDLESLSQEQMNELIKNSKFIANKEFDYNING
jgi:hypothetical protein